MILTWNIAIEEGLVKEGTYIRVCYPDGRKVDFRAFTYKYLRKLELVGPPTKEKLQIKGENGYYNLENRARALVRKEYSLPIFEELDIFGVYWVSKEAYNYNGKMSAYRNANQREEFKHPDDCQLEYGLGCGFGDIISGIETEQLSVWYVSNNRVWLHEVFSCGYHRSPIHEGSIELAFRPLAFPQETIRLQLEGHDGSKENPYVCLGITDDGDEAEHNDDEKSLNANADTAEASDQKELQNLIKAGREWLERGQELFTKLEPYAKNLK